MFCFHKWNDPIGRYQSCKKCNKLRVVPCAHNWEVVDKHLFKVFEPLDRGPVLVIKIIKRCTVCGEHTISSMEG